MLNAAARLPTRGARFPNPSIWPPRSFSSLALAPAFSEEKAQTGDNGGGLQAPLRCLPRNVGGHPTAVAGRRTCLFDRRSRRETSDENWARHRVSRESAANSGAGACVGRPMGFDVAHPSGRILLRLCSRTERRTEGAPGGDWRLSESTRLLRVHRWFEIPE